MYFLFLKSVTENDNMEAARNSYLAFGMMAITSDAVKAHTDPRALGTIIVGTYEFNCRQASCSKKLRLLVVFGRCHGRILVWTTAGVSGICNGFIQRSHENDGKI